MKSFFRIGLILMTVALLLTAIAVFTASATESDSVPSATIARYNLSLKSAIYIQYAVKTENLEEGSVVTVLAWSEEDYLANKPNPTATLNSLGTQTIGGVKHLIFEYRDVAARQMTENVYAKVAIDGVVQEGVYKYSILQYAYNKLGKTGTASSDEGLINMLHSILQYGATAQIHFGNKTDRLATDEFVQIELVGGTLPDGTASGLYKIGTELTLTAPETNADGVAFTGWQNVSGNLFSSNLTATITVGANNTTYTACYGDPVFPTPDTYLTFTLLEESDTYSVTVNNADALPAVLEIPTKYNGRAVTHIEAGAFANCTGLKSVVIPNSITDIGIAAFSGCSALEHIAVPFIGASQGCADTPFGYLFSSSNSNGRLPSTLKTVVVTGGDRIGNHAFSSCSYLTGITIPNGVTSIGDYAFSDCTRLVNINIPEGVESIGERAFFRCSSLKTLALPNGVTSIGNSAFAGCEQLVNINISEGVKSIGDKAFEDCSSLETLALPNSVTSIGSHAFSNCSQLVSMNLPDGIETVSSGLFYHCLNLTTVKLPDSVTKIGSAAFADCCGLTSINIPTGVTSIGSDAFRNCTGVIETVNGVSYVGNWAIDYDNSVADVTLLAGTVGIADSAFVGSSLRNLVLQDGVKYIGSDLFSSYHTLESITIPNTVISISERMFVYSHVSTVYYTGTLGEWHTVTRGQEIDGLKSVPLHVQAATQPTANEYFIFTLLEDGTYSIQAKDVTSLPPDLVIPSVYAGAAVTHIADEAFRDATGLITVVIPDSITSIGSAAFAGCSKMITITVPFIGSSVDVDYDMHFGYLFSSSTNSESYLYVPSSLRTVVVTGGDRIGDEAFYNCTMLTDIILPDSVMSIGNKAFYYCTTLKALVLPNGVTSIGEYAFYNCNQLESINIPNGITEIKQYTFYACAFADVRLPAGLQSIGDYAFYSTALTAIEIPNGVTSIGIRAFSGCPLTTVALPDSIETIENGAFADCSSLTSITLGNGVTSIGDSAFNHCYRLTSIIIPDSVKSIGDYAFNDCYDLISITIGSGVTSVGESTFSGCSGVIQIENGVSYVDKWVIDCDPSVTEVILRADTAGIADWAFRGCCNMTSIEIPQSVKAIGEGAFSGCGKLTDITLPDCITVINDHTFESCSALVSITIPDGVTYIGVNAFSNCSMLASINIPDGVTYIGGHAFSGCENLTTVIIPNGVSKIYTYTFFGCSSLTSIVIGSGVTEIEHYAFYYAALDTVYYAGTPEMWNAMTYNPITCTTYFYSATNPFDTVNSVYRHWHYVDGVPTLWPIGAHV